MEIIHLILGKANPERMNGINRVVYQLATQQHLQGRNVRVWGITRDLSHNYKERAFPTELFAASWHPFGVSNALRKALRAKADRQDVVFHLHGGWVPVYATLARLLHRLRLSFVITGHGAYNTVAMQRSSRMKKYYFRFLEKSILDRALRIHSIGHSEVDGLSRVYPNQKNLRLPYGFEPATLSAEGARGGSGFIIGFVGRLDIWTKGLDLLLHSFQTFRREHSDAQLWIVGDGPGRATLSSQIEAEQIPGVVLWGSKFSAEKDALIAQMHVFVHPSRNEGLPASVLESSAMGIPAIVSKPTNVAEMIEHYQAGWVLPQNTSEELTRAFVLSKQADALQRQQRSDNARLMVAEAFSWKNLVPQYDALYKP